MLSPAQDEAECNAKGGEVLTGVLRRPTFCRSTNLFGVVAGCDRVSRRVAVATGEMSLEVVTATECRHDPASCGDLAGESGDLLPLLDYQRADLVFDQSDLSAMALCVGL